MALPNPIVDPITPSATQGMAVGSQNLNEAANRAMQERLAQLSANTQTSINDKQIAAQASEHDKYQQFLGQQQQGQQAFSSGENQKQRDFQEKLAARGMAMQKAQQDLSFDLMGADDDTFTTLAPQLQDLTRQGKDLDAKQAAVAFAQQVLAQSDAALPQKITEMQTKTLAAMLPMSNGSRRAATMAMKDIQSSLALKDSGGDTPYQRYMKDLTTTRGMLHVASSIATGGGMWGDVQRTKLDELDRGNALGVVPKGVTGDSMAKDTPDTPAHSHYGGVEGIAAAAGMSPEDVAGLPRKEVMRVAAKGGTKLLLNDFADKYMDYLGGSEAFPAKNDGSLPEAKGVLKSYLQGLAKAVDVAEKNAGTPSASKAALAQIMKEEVTPAYQKLSGLIGEVQAATIVRQLGAIGSGDISQVGDEGVANLFTKSEGKVPAGMSESELSLRKQMGQNFIKMQAAAHSYGLDTPAKNFEDTAKATGYFHDLLEKSSDYGKFLHQLASDSGVKEDELDSVFGASLRPRFDQLGKYGGGRAGLKMAAGEVEAQIGALTKQKDEVANQSAQQQKAGKKASIEKYRKEYEKRIAPLIGP